MGFPSLGMSHTAICAFVRASVCPAGLAARGRGLSPGTMPGPWTDGQKGATLSHPRWTEQPLDTPLQDRDLPLMGCWEVSAVLQEGFEDSEALDLALCTRTH